MSRRTLIYASLLGRLRLGCNVVFESFPSLTIPSLRNVRNGCDANATQMRHTLVLLSVNIPDGYKELHSEGPTSIKTTITRAQTSAPGVRTTSASLTSRLPVVFKIILATGYKNTVLYFGFRSDAAPL
ncbi:uncharacterized protein ARMOST_19039 [Armillaria ostoyae]|uniref:Uncharacterized protein n=1 Tax=Armillaria ostoyae TaxID=47428 RepID=A0A284S3F1_ARMOS|nr:uncharacterized protein ARMOST_19039 [Armillaria ostoyae]